MGCLFAILGGLATTPANAASLLYVEASHKNLQTGATGGENDGGPGGPGDSYIATTSGPTLDGSLPATGAAFADDDGVFWASASVESIEPYSIDATAVWEDELTREAGSNAIFANITGATLELIDWGAFLDTDLIAGMRFEAVLNGETVLLHETTLSGRGGEPDSFSLDTPSELPGSIDTYSKFLADGSDYIYSATYSLAPISAAIDLSGIAVGESFTIRFIATVFASNAGGETFAKAWFRDPISQSGGISVSYGNLAGSVATVPAPAALWLMAAGIAPLAAAARRRKHRAA